MQAAADEETLNLQSSNNSLNCISTGQLRIQIQKPKAGQTYKVQLTAFPTGYTGPTEFTITAGDKDGAITFVKFTGYDMPAGNYKGKIITPVIPNTQEVPATIGKLVKDFPAPNRNNNDFGSDQVYREILDASGEKDCNYAAIRFGGNTNSPFYKYFTKPELIALYEYTAYSDYDLQNIYGGNRDHPNIQWRDLFSKPAGKSSPQKVVYYDMGAHGRTYKDMKEDPNKRPKFYFRIKGHNGCNNQDAPMESGDMRFMGASLTFGGTCTAPQMTVRAFNHMFCDPATYVVKEKVTNIQVATGTIKLDEIKSLSTLDNGQPFDRTKVYEVTVTSRDGQTYTESGSFNNFYNALVPNAGFTIATRCYGSSNSTKGYIEVLFRNSQGTGAILPMEGYKVTLLQAPAGYTEEEGKIKLNETVTISLKNKNKVTTNILATTEQDVLTKYFTLPEGQYKIKVEDPCGRVTYVRNSWAPITQEVFNLTYPTDYQEKALTPETETECAKVKVYPFRGNPAFDWLKYKNANKAIYVYLFKRPNGINAGDVTVSSNLSESLGGTNYIKAVYNPSDPTSVNQYFSLPRNQNSDGKYTFVYGGRINAANNSDASDVIQYIISNGTRGCARTFEVKVDDVLLNFDPNTYIGYRCDNNTGKIVVKAINGVSGSGNYTYELYDTKEGNLIESKTEAKGTEVTFTNLGTFVPGQNTRWVKIIDSACTAAPVWRKLPIANASQANLLLKNPLRASYCQGESVSIELRPIGATKYVWTLPDGSSQETTEPKLDIASLQATHSGTYAVKAEGLTCGANTLTFSYNVNVLQKPTEGQTYTLCQGAKISDLKTQVDTNTSLVKVYKNNILVTDDNELLTFTDTYTVSRFSTTCETDKVGVIVSLAQLAKPIVTVTSATCAEGSKAKITNYTAGYTYWVGTVQLTVNASGEITTPLTAGNHTIVAKNGTCESLVSDSFTMTDQKATPSSPTVTTLTECPTLVSTQFDMATLVTASAGHTLKWYDAATGGTALAASPKVERQVTAKSVTTKYVSQEKDGCESARVAVTYTVDDTVAPTLTADDIVLDCTAANFDTLVTTWLTTTAARATDTCTTPVVTNNYSKPTDLCGAGEIEVTFTAKDSFGNQTQKKAKIRFIVAKDDDYTATPVTPSATEQVVKDGSGTPYNVLSNDNLYGNGATTSNVTISEVTPNANVKIDTTTGQVKVQPNTPAGTYTVTYRICDKNTPTACSNVATVTVKVTSSIDAVNDPDQTIPTTGGTVDILSNDKLNGNPVTKDQVNISIDNNGSLTGVSIDSTTGKLVVPNGTTPGTYTVTYKICDKANPTVCDTATVKITIAGGTIRDIEAVDDGVWEVGTQGEFLTPSILDNDRIGSKIGLSASEVRIEKAQGQPAPDSHLVMNADGHITVKEGIAIGTYIYYYTIIDKSNNNQTSSAKATIKVVSFVAQQDEYSMTNTKDREQKTPSVITNDEMDGKKPPVIGTDVTLTPGTPSHPNLRMNPDGTITIAPNTPDGVYTYDYTICRVSAPGDCKTAKAIIELHPALEANDDDYSARPINTAQQPIVVGNVLDNDTLAGAKITDPTKVAITLIDNDGLSGVSFAPNGEITVPQGANEGTYRVRYNLCMAQQLSVCDDAVVTIVITKNKPLTIYNGVSSNSDGKNDGFTIEGIEAYPKNTLKIFNRWGVLVYQKEGYTNSDPFTGYSNGRSTIESGKKLPQGTYYYILEYQDSVGQTHNHSGWLYLKKE
ncbi:T9SS type B sorting domain-containing protein [Capnocytophaga gingivalis]|uniref:T9SS type B sorting domain-containing protein n=1 Tax=Capnocytophaga gingivalis TaxID=1017 RepID=UPI00403D62BB